MIYVTYKYIVYNKFLCTYYKQLLGWTKPSAFPITLLQDD